MLRVYIFKVTMCWQLPITALTICNPDQRFHFSLSFFLSTCLTQNMLYNPTPVIAKKSYLIYLIMYTISAGRIQCVLLSGILLWTRQTDCTCAIQIPLCYKRITLSKSIQGNIAPTSRLRGRQCSSQRPSSPSLSLSRIIY